MTERLIEQVEGEALLLFRKGKSGKISHARILFPHFRGIEKILERKEALDALAVTPRVCGICGHAHLMAAAAALEGCYEAAGEPLEISPKAEKIRRFTLALERVQNHLKWFYLVLLPSVPGYDYRRDSSILAAHRAASLCARAIAQLAGQWPHTSYALPGGVMCDPTHLELLQAESYVDEALRLTESALLGMEAAAFAEGDDPARLAETGAEFARLMRHFEKEGWSDVGRSHDRFLVLADHLLGPCGKSIKTRIASVDASEVKEERPDAVRGYDNHARPVTYRGRYYETGPLARAMVAKDPLIRRMHRRYKDASLTRIAARVREAAALLLACKESLRTMDLSEPSYLEPAYPLHALGSVQGRGAVEAARGSLLHTVRLQKGRIVRYCIVTPTQWNLAGGTEKNPGVAQKAMIGLTEQTAEMVFKSFDVCSVCTTQ